MQLRFLKPQVIAVFCVLLLLIVVLNSYLKYAKPRYKKGAIDYNLVVPVQGVHSLGFISPFQDLRRYKKGKISQHNAIDIYAPVGTPIIAPYSGKIADKYKSKGNGGFQIRLYDSRGKYAYLFLHCSKFAPGITNGKQVRKGDIIAYVGQTGNARRTPPHLHFAVHKIKENGKLDRENPVDPELLLQHSEIKGYKRISETYRSKLFCSAYFKGFLIPGYGHLINRLYTY